MLAKHALIVDDSQTARAVLKHQLNQFDVIVESAADGSDALKMLRDHIPDVIFLDHIMPGLDGFQVLQLLKGDRATRDIPVVMYTSQAATQYTSEAKSLGAIGVIPKKVTNEQLVHVLDKAELYRLKAVNEEHHTPPASTEESSESAAPGKVIEIPAGHIKLPGSNQTDHVPKTADQPAVVPSAEFAPPGIRTGSQQPEYTRSRSARGWLVAILLTGLVGFQSYGYLRDQQQQEVITDLRQQLDQQEQQILQTRDQLTLEQSQLADATWKQVQFVVDVLVDQIKKEE